MTTTLLAVDDSKTMRKVLEITFAGEDYRTILAEGSADALAKVRTDNPAVALVDANLAEESGYDLCQRIKQDSPGIAVLMLTSKQQPYDRARGATVGADDFMDKPFDTQQLIDKVVGLVRRAAEPAVRAAAPAPAVRPAPAPAPAARPIAPAVLAPVAPPATPAAKPVAPVAAQGVRPVNLPAAGQTTLSPGRPAQVSPAAGRPIAAPAPVVPPPVAPVAAAPAAVRPPSSPQAAPGPAPVAAPAKPAVATAAASVALLSSDLQTKLQGLGLTSAQLEGVLALSKDVVERVVWEVVPQLAEAMIKEELQRLTSD